MTTTPSQTSLLTADKPNATSGPPEKTIAILPLNGTTVTATAVPSTSFLAVVDGTTISFRAEGITLSDGQVFSLGYDGLVDTTTTGKFQAVSADATTIMTTTTAATTPSVRYDSTRHPTSQISVTNGDESSWIAYTSPTETTSADVGDISSTLTYGDMSSDSGLQVTGTGQASVSATTTENSVITTTGTSSTTTSTVSGSGSESGTSTGSSTTTGGSGAQSQYESGVGLRKFAIALLGLVGVLGL